MTNTSSRRLSVLSTGFLLAVVALFAFSATAEVIAPLHSNVVSSCPEGFDLSIC